MVSSKQKEFDLSRVVIVGALPESLVNFRGDLIRDLVSRGHQVFALASHASPETVARIECLGASFHPFHVNRTGLNPASDIRTLIELRGLFRTLRPDVVMTYTVKPTIWGGLALRTLFSDARLICLITGIGMTLEDNGGWRTMLRVIVESLYRSALYRAELVVFQNCDDRRKFCEAALVESSRCTIVDGSGVNLERFPQQPLPATSPFVFLTVARLLKAKGLRELARASAEVKRVCPDVVIRLVGPRDASPDHLPNDELANWSSSQLIDYGGESSDIAGEMQRCHVFVLPSYHEGLPRTVIEAMATGRPIITTSAPGCRETVVEGENGYLVPVRDHQILAKRMMSLVGDIDVCRAMANRSRKIAEERFDVRIVNMRMVQLIEGEHRSLIGIQMLSNE